MDAVNLYNEAYKAIEQGMAEEAISKYFRILELGHVNNKILAAAYNDLAVLYFQNNQLDKAVEYFKKASDIDPEIEDLKENINQITLKIKDFIGVYKTGNSIFKKPQAYSPFLERKGFVKEDYLGELLQSIPGRFLKILHIGYNIGSLDSMLKNRNKNVQITGIETDLTINETQHAHIDRFFVADIETVDFICPEKYFDCIIYEGILERLKEPSGLVENHKKFLSDDGVVTAIVPNVQHFSVILELLSGKWEYKKDSALNSEHIRFFTHNGLKELFKNVGYLISDIKGHKTYPLPEKFKEFIKLNKHLALFSNNFELETQSYYFTLCANKTNTAAAEAEKIKTLSYSGERMVPGKSEWQTELQHQKRYHYFQPLSKGKTTLDAGCGEGYGAYLLSWHTDIIDAIDKDRETIDYAKNRYKRNHLSYNAMNLLNLSAEKKYECIYSFGVIEQVNDHNIFLNNLKNAVKDDGILVISTVNKNFTSPDRPFPANPFNKTEWTFKDFRQLINEYFKYVEMYEQVDDIIIPVADKENSNGQFFIAVCSNAPLPDINEIIKTGLDEEKISIVVVTGNNVEHTKQCMESIRRYTYNPYEIIVIDNASTDGTIEYLKTQGNTRIIINKSDIGPWKSYVQGIGTVSNRHTACLKNNIVVSRNWLDKMQNAIKADKKIGVVGPYSNFAEGSQQDNVMYESMEEFLEYSEIIEGKNFEKSKKTEMLSDFCFLVSMHLIKDISMNSIKTFENSGKFFKMAMKKGYELVIKEDTFVHNIS